MIDKYKKNLAKSMPDGLEIIFLNSVPRRTRIQRRGRSDKKSETGFSGKVSSRLRCANAGEFQNTLLKGSRHSERETPGQKGISTKAFLTNGWCTKRFRGQRPLTTTLSEGTGVLRTGVLENRRSGKTGVPEAAVLGNGVPGSALAETGVEPKILGKLSVHLLGRFRSFARTIPSRSTRITASGVILK